MPETSHNPDDLTSVVARLHAEFAQVHRDATISRCVTAARQGALAVAGHCTPDLVERIARQHLNVLAAAYAEKQ